MRDALTAIPAPYNFVPLSDWVHCPADGERAGHDLPFENGLCGEIPFTLVAESPLLVGGEQRKATDRCEGEVFFARTPGGYGIPGSALRGMLRSVIEIAGFGRMRQVDDARYGLRDIAASGTTPYTSKVRGKVKTAFLRRGEDGRRELVPCRMVRLDHRRIEDWLGYKGHGGIFPTRKGVGDKYRIWRDAVGNRASETELAFDAEGDEAVNLGRGRATGHPVFTGQISDSTRDKGKRRDFVFYDADESAAFPVAAEDWRAFLLIHGDEDGKPDMSWPGYWRERFQRGHAIPVFYFDDGADADGRRRVRLGLAYMPKLAWDFSVHDLVKHASREHLFGPDAPDPEIQDHQGGKYDLADLLFGTLAHEPSRILKGRVSCGLALALGNPEPERSDETILNGPKPTYFPNYLKQPTDASTGHLAGGEYATCIATPGNPEPRIRGFKRYPARPQACVQPLTGEQKAGKKGTHIRLNPLPAGTRFAGTIAFHNLRPFELGALVWALTWGERAELKHGLGMGKPFGYGQVHFEIDWSATWARTNRDLRTLRRAPVDPSAASGAFAEHMEEMWRAANRSGTWTESPQIANLLAMASPTRAPAFEEKAGLHHMRLERCEEPGTGKRVNRNEFTWAKQVKPNGLVLMDYAVATGAASAAPEPAGPGRNRPAASATGRGAAAPRPREAESGATHPWLVEHLPKVAKANNIPHLPDVWGTRPLADAWSAIADAEERAAVRAEIAAYWQAQGWWDNPPKGAKRKAREVYGDD